MPIKSLPVLMYHYVSHYIGPINVTPETFEAHCKGMAQAGWRGISLSEAEAWFKNGTPLPRGSALITFDDGFLDNAVYAYPILERYGHKGVVFAVTERLEHGETPRPTLKDVWEGRLGHGSLPPVDNPVIAHPLGYRYRNDIFMSWAEARSLESSGVMSIAGHTAKHTAVCAGPSFPPLRGETRPDSRDDAARRFHIPGRRGNTFYRLGGEIPWGMPRFKEQPAMSGPGFVPSSALLEAVRELVPQDKEKAFAFFRSESNVHALHRLVDSFSPEALGRMETDDEARSRMQADLSQCADTLKQELGHDVASLCWPWGRGSDMARREAERLGFSVFYETQPGANAAGQPLAVRRFKVRNKPWSWLRLRLYTYSRPLFAHVYAALKG